VFDQKEAERHNPRVVFVDAQNRIVRPPLRAQGWPGHRCPALRARRRLHSGPRSPCGPRCHL